MSAGAVLGVVHAFSFSAARAAKQSFVSKVETGERRIDPTELEKFAKLYGKPITFFLSG